MFPLAKPGQEANTAAARKTIGFFSLENALTVLGTARGFEKDVTLQGQEEPSRDLRLKLSFANLPLD